jgi:hypothetical protein
MNYQDPRFAGTICECPRCKNETDEFDLIYDGIELVCPDCFNEFEILAANEPKKAYEIAPKLFCNYVKENICNSLTDDEIKEIFENEKLS